MRHNYCTVYSKEYVYMGLILYNSLLKYDQDFYLYIFFMDDEALEIMKSMNLERAVLISLKDVEAEDQELSYTKNSRTDKEYSWTIKGSAMLYLLKHMADLEHIVWLDGDLKFLSDPQPIFDEFEKCSILLTEEKYTGPYEYLSKIYGVYQLGFIGFKRDENAIECLKWYRERLLEWCYENPDEGKWSDQRYAVDWPVRYKNVGIVQNLGVNLTPFILYRFQQEGKCLVHRMEDGVYTDDTKIIFFHYYGFKYYDGNEFDLCRHWAKFSDDTLSILYLDYIYSVNEAMEAIRRVFPDYYKNSFLKGKYVSNYFNLDLTQHDCEYFYYSIADSRNAARLIALDSSISRFMGNYRLWVCCLDDKAYVKLKKANLKNVILVDIKNLEDAGFSRIKNSCSKAQYKLLLKAAMAYFILKNNYSVEKLMYLDSSMYFFSNPTVLFESWEDGCIFVPSFNGMIRKQKTLGVPESGLIGFVRKLGAFYFLEDYMRMCANSQNTIAQQGYTHMPLVDYYGIVQNRRLAANINNSLLKFISVDAANNRILCFEKELICFNFGEPRDLRLLSHASEKGKHSYPRKQTLKQIYQSYLNSLKEAYQKIGDIF